MFIKNFNSAEGDTIFSFSPLADAGAGYERVDNDGNTAADGAHAKYLFANGATLIVEGMGATGVSFASIGTFDGSIETYSALDFTTDASSSTPTTASAITNETDIISSDTDTFFKGQLANSCSLLVV